MATFKNPPQPQPVPTRGGNLPKPEPRDPRPALYLPLSAAWKYLLMAGEHAPERVFGWPEQAMATGGVDGAQRERDEAAALWSVHGPALTDEATAAGFTPFWGTKRVPKGPTFDRWAAAFLAAHRY